MGAWLQSRRNTASHRTLTRRMRRTPMLDLVPERLDIIPGRRPPRSCGWRSTTSRIIAASLLSISMSACSHADPAYTGVSIEALNYLPYNLARFAISDQFGNTVRGGGDLEPGAGEGSIACCYSLKGTNFKVRWAYYDADDWRPGEQVKKQWAEAGVSLPPTKMPDSIGSRILEIHFYPDHHVELALPGEMLGSTRLPIVDASRGLMKRYESQLGRKYQDNDAQLHRRISRAVAEAWLKYRFTDLSDLEQYAYYALLVNPRFDAHPDMQQIIQSSKAKPGAFAKAVAALPPAVAKALAHDRFGAVAVPSISAGLLPSSRVENGQAPS